MTPLVTVAETALADLAARIPSLDAGAMAAAAAHLDQLTKPPGSLGRLEAIVVTLAGITGRSDASVARRAIVIAAADHGVTRQGVSAYPADVTPQMVANFVAGGAAINALAGAVGARVVVIDVGVAGEIPAAASQGGAGGELVRARLRPGTDDMTQGPAMTRDEALAAIAIGVEQIGRLADAGLDLVGIGEMGIGNTTAASAITAVMTGRAVAAVTGRGTGIDDGAHRRKIAAIERAIAVNQPDPNDPIGVLAGVGGLEIAALVGVILGAAERRIPVLLDGFITGAAALVAVAIAPAVGSRLLAAHRSVEPGHAVTLAHLDIEPLLDLGLRLGEGTGAAVAMSVVIAATRVRDEMATFASAAVSGPTDR